MSADAIKSPCTSFTWGAVVVICDDSGKISRPNPLLLSLLGGNYYVLLWLIGAISICATIEST